MYEMEYLGSAVPSLRVLSVESFGAPDHCGELEDAAHDDEKHTDTCTARPELSHIAQE